VTVTARLLAIQAQDARAARLAIRARTNGLTVADIERALDDRALVITWFNRGTLQLVRREDYFWLHALTAPPMLTGIMRRLAQEGVSAGAADRGVDVIERSLAEEGPLTRHQLRDRIDAAGVRTEGQAMVHLLALASLREVLVRGPMVGRQHAYALTRDWLGAPDGPPGPVGRDRAVAELARRFLVGHAPADDRDLARWAGLPLRDARVGLSAIASELVQRGDGLLELRGAEHPSKLPAPRLLGAYEPVLLGWRDRSPLIGPHRNLITTNGIFRPFAMVDGLAVATWRLHSGAVELEPLEPLPERVREALQAEAGDVERFLGRG